jgi:hypothetical protein
LEKHYRDENLKKASPVLPCQAFKNTPPIPCVTSILHLRCSFSLPFEILQLNKSNITGSWQQNPFDPTTQDMILPIPMQVMPPIT